MPIRHPSSHSAQAAPGKIAMLLLAGTLAGCSALPCSKPCAENVVEARHLTLQATDAMQRGEWDEAEDIFRHAISSCPTDERTHSRYSKVLWRRGAGDEAIEHMEKAVELSGGAPELRIELGNMYLSRGELANAEEEAEKVIAADRKLAGGWALAGQLRRKRSDPQGALACFHRALYYQPHFPQVQLSVAEIYHDQGRYYREYSTLVALGDGYAHGKTPTLVLHRQGVSLKAMDRHEDAIECLTAAVNRGEPTAELLFELAEAQMQAGHITNARLALNDALGRSPNHSASQQLKTQLERLERPVAAANH